MIVDDACSVPGDKASNLFTSGETIGKSNREVRSKSYKSVKQEVELLTVGKLERMSFKFIATSSSSS